MWNIIVSGVIGAFIGGNNSNESRTNSRLFILISLVALFAIIAVILNLSDTTLAEALGIDTQWTTIKNVFEGSFTFLTDPVGYWSTIGTGIGALWRRRITNVVDLVK